MPDGGSLNHDALLSGGGTVHIRSAEPTDGPALRALNDAASDQSIRFRFFGLNRDIADKYIDQLLQPADVNRQVLIADIDGVLVGVGSVGNAANLMRSGSDQLCASAF